MRQRGRKSQASYDVPTVSGASPRLDPPSWLTKDERVLFVEIVRACSPSHFVRSDLPLLISFVQTTLLARKAARDPEGIGAWEKAVRSQCQLARALRLTVQSRADPKTIGRRMPEQRQSAYDTGWEDLDA